MTLQERIDAAHQKVSDSLIIAQEAEDEAMGAEAIGFHDRALLCHKRQIKHEDRAAVWSATARQLREQIAARPAVSLAAADGTPHAEDQAHQLDAERSEALGLAAAS